VTVQQKNHTDRGYLESQLKMNESERAIGMAWMRSCERRDLIQKFVDTTRAVVRVPHFLAKKSKDQG